MNRDLSLQQIAEAMTKSLLNASEKDLEGFQKIVDATVELREAHKDLQKMVQQYSSSSIRNITSS
ncbi:hypothetical protein JCM9140_329 [Halalkalibacter wakoensis JCM 9140]|uniref:Uncharacterized protein n=1 Tax=Halalkalibacter wakoensis JCM 9140 TaxID=1236970 RepID=W4PZ91_9BACI|nr:hypothetical protein [Halalkalibacter wakoensis]GAE24409.1 hypothetical protein JCM9140_329 [Halalkalibacter wakoensis JCM 9140]